VGVVVDALYLRGGELRVALRGGEALMAEHLLNGAQVRAFFQHVGAEGVAQSMGMEVGGKAARERDALDDAADAARGEAGGATGAKVGDERAVEDEGLLTGGAQAGLARGQAGADGVGGLVAEGDVALLAALAADEEWRRSSTECQAGRCRPAPNCGCRSRREARRSCVALRPRSGRIILRGGFARG